MLQQLMMKTSVTYSEIEQMVGRLVSLECAVSAGMWYTRHQYAAMTSSGIKPDSKKKVKDTTMIYVTAKVREEWYLWVYFLQENKGSLGNLCLIYLSKLMFIQMLLVEALLGW